MADVRIKIGVQDGYEDVITSVNYSQDTNNVSRPTSYKTTENSGKNLKSWAKTIIKNGEETGSLSLADGYVGGNDSFLGEQGKYNGFMFGAVSPDGQYTLTLTIDGSNIDSITVFGDRDANQFPIRAYLDGDNSNFIFSDDPQWTIIFPNKASSHTITFDLWNRPNYNACITHISIFVNELWFDNKWLKNIESTSQSADDPSVLFYGVLPNSANIDILDRNGEIYDYINDGILPNSSLPVTIFVNGKQVQQHIVQDSDYDVNGRTLNFTLQNKLTDWETIKYNGFAYPKKEEIAYNMLVSVFNSVGYNDEEIKKMLSNKILFGQGFYDTIENYLKRIVIPYPYLEPDTLKNTVEKFCQLAQLQVFKNDNNETVFVSARPLYIKNYSSNIINIEKRNIFGQVSKTIVLKNKYKAIEIDENQVKDVVDFNTIVGTIPDEDKKIDSNYTKIQNTDISQAYYAQSLGVSTIYSYSGAYLINELYYKTKQFRFPKDSNYNLEMVLKAYEQQEINKYSVNTEKHSGKATATFHFDASNFQSGNPTISNLNYSEDILQNENSNEKIDSMAEYNPEFPPAYSTSKRKLNASQTNQTIIEVLDNGTEYVVSANLLVGQKITKLYGLTPTYAGSEGRDFTISGDYIEFIPKEVELSIYGDKRTISFDIISASDSNINSVDTFASVETNELIQENTTLNSIKISNIIKDNIKEDYINGIANVSLTVSCGDYYDIYGIKQKEWSSGEILEVSDYVKLWNDNRVWRVVGRTFKKQGVPMIDLELQEVKVIELKEYTINYPQGNTYGNFIEQIDGTPVEDGQSVVEGTVLTYKKNSRLKQVFVNGKQIQPNESFVVKSDIYITYTEVPKYTINYPTTNEYGYFIRYSNNTEVGDGESVLEGTILTYSGDYRITHLYINGIEIQSNETFVVNSDIYISYDYYETKEVEYYVSFDNLENYPNETYDYNSNNKDLAVDSLYNAQVLVNVNDSINPTLFNDLEDSYQNDSCSFTNSSGQYVSFNISINNKYFSISNFYRSNNNAGEIIVSRFEGKRGTRYEKPH